MTSGDKYIDKISKKHQNPNENDEVYLKVKDTIRHYIYNNGNWFLKNIEDNSVVPEPVLKKEVSVPVVEEVVTTTSSDNDKKEDEEDEEIANKKRITKKDTISFVTTVHQILTHVNQENTTTELLVESLLELVNNFVSENQITLKSNRKPRKRSQYNEYVSKEMKRLREENPDMKPKDILKEAVSKWKATSSLAAETQS